MTTCKTSEKIDQYFEKREIISRLNTGGPDVVCVTE